ncbi:MAG TPA: hypothetical protein VFB34_01195 [Chloroflexota bacterium]|nr:hypothetical protein [Chloroflexota bacterium]
MGQVARGPEDDYRQWLRRALGGEAGSQWIGGLSRSFENRGGQVASPVMLSMDALSSC